MKTIIYTIINVLIFQNLYSQQTTFSKVLYTENQIDLTVNKVVPIINSGYIAVGNNGLIIKTDLLGNVEWYKQFTPYINFNSAITTNDNCFVTVGEIRNNSSNNYEGLILKFDLNGDTIWSKTVERAEKYVEITSISQTSDNGFVLSGNTSNFQSFIYKIDAEGNFQWTKTFTVNEFRSYLYSIKQTQNGNFIIVGHIARGLPSSYWEFNYILLNISNEGDLLWSKKYFAEYNNSYFKATDFQITNTGYVILVQRGSVTSLYKTDFAGEVIWNKFYYSSGTDGLTGNANQNLFSTSDGGFIYTYGSRAGGGVIKTDSIGNPISASVLEMEPISISETINKEYNIFGNGPLYGVKNYSDVIGIIQIDSLFNSQDCNYSFNTELLNDTIYSEAISVSLSENLLPNKIPMQISLLEISNYDGCVGRTGSINETKNNSIEIYPNPSKGNFTVDLKNNKQGVLTLYNLQGQKIYEVNIQTTQININLTTVLNGIYFYQFLNSDSQIYTGKIIINK